MSVEFRNFISKCVFTLTAPLIAASHNQKIIFGHLAVASTREWPLIAVSYSEIELKIDFICFVTYIDQKKSYFM